MIHAHITIPGNPGRIVTISDVTADFDPATGQRFLVLDRREAGYLLSEWVEATTARGGWFREFKRSFAIGIDDRMPEEWAEIEQDSGASEAYSLAEFPFELTVTDDQYRPPRTMTDEEALDHLAALHNREGDSAADFVSYLHEVLTATGRLLRP